MTSSSPSPDIQPPSLDTQAALAWLRYVAARLSARAGAGAMHEARLLLALALGREAPVLSHEDIAISGSVWRELDQLILARASGQPISRLRGWREFYGLRFQLNGATLDPRPDSEVLVDMALKFAGGAFDANLPLRVLDMGTGTGCLLLSCLANLPGATGIGTDLSAEALQQAQINAENLGLSDRARFHLSDWDQSLPDISTTDDLAAGGGYHLIFCNPPYIETGDGDSLSAEVIDHDPHLALFAGADGLEAYRLVMPACARQLAPSGRAFIELGYGQAEAVSRLAEAANLDIVARHDDLAGICRCLEIQHKG